MKTGMVLWGFHPLYSTGPIKLSLDTSQANRRWRRSLGWIVAVYPIGCTPTGLIDQARAYQRGRK